VVLTATPDAVYEYDPFTVTLSLENRMTVNITNVIASLDSLDGYYVWLPILVTNNVFPRVTSMTFMYLNHSCRLATVSYSLAKL
jgi:hypothetical protein